MGEGRVREILDQEELEQQVRGADRNTVVTVAGTGLGLTAFGPLGGLIIGALTKFSQGRKQARFQARVDGTFRGIERRLGELGDRLDEGFVITDEFLEMLEESLERVHRERDERKRDLYASILANAARVNINRSFYPTALKLLDALAPIHVEILRDLLLRREKHEEGGGEHNTSTRELAIKLHLDDLERLRLAGLSDEMPDHFSMKLDGVRAWDEALGTADTYGGPHAKTLKDKFQGWNDDVLAHVQYMQKEGLVEQVSERRSSITQLSIRLLEWLAEPEA